MQGATEALRGTFNDSIDRRYHGPDDAVHAKNQATIAAGRQQIESQHFTPRESRPKPPAADAPPVPPIKTAYGGPPVSGSQVENGSRGAKFSSFIKKKMDIDGTESAKRHGSDAH